LAESQDKILLYNTLTREKDLFVPITPGEVGLYTCGPTVYNFQHIGNFKTFIFEDTLVRMLRYNGYDVDHVMNITDVGHLTSDADEGEDKMIKAMRREVAPSPRRARCLRKVTGRARTGEAGASRSWTGSIDMC